MKNIFLTLLIIAINFLHGQDIKSDLMKINKNYKSKEFTANISYTFFSNGKQVDEATALHIQDGADYYYKVKDIEVINNNKCQLIVNHVFKSVSVMPSGNKDEHKELSSIPLDTALKEVLSYSYESKGNNIGSYNVELKKGKYKKVEIFFNTTNHKITKLRLHVRKEYDDPDFENGIMEIEYKSFQNSISKENKALLKETRFVNINSGKVSLLAAYTKYELNNYLNIKPE